MDYCFCLLNLKKNNEISCTICFDARIPRKSIKSYYGVISSMEVILEPTHYIAYKSPNFTFTVVRVVAFHLLQWMWNWSTSTRYNGSSAAFGSLTRLLGSIAYCNLDGLFIQCKPWRTIWYPFVKISINIVINPPSHTLFIFNLNIFHGKLITGWTSHSNLSSVKPGFRLDNWFTQIIRWGSFFSGFDNVKQTNISVYTQDRFWLVNKVSKAVLRTWIFSCLFFTLSKPKKKEAHLSKYII